MTQTLEQFTAAVRTALQSDPGPKGREKVRLLLEEALKDKSFAAKYLPDGGPERETIYRDPQLNFCLLAYCPRESHKSKPHDHGPTWAIYGQALGETEMKDFEIVDRAAPGKTGTARELRTYVLKPGMAHLYNEGQLHGIHFNGGARILRVEGAPLEGVKRLAYEAV
jgi:hypothetical protein